MRRSEPMSWPQRMAHMLELLRLVPGTLRREPEVPERTPEERAGGAAALTPR